ncbi:hypothetical protein [Mycolicibacterium sp.]|uniref:hypothetical protein n=1 Tax=Mycolicibacterium sp. TaxID=2320850 RepID=UPI0025ED359E|nr:hypothetical protein [Mycolicibacterium sp.]
MHVKIEKGAAWLGLAMLIGFMALFVLVAGLIPPMDPGASANEIAKIYSEHGVRIRVGLALMALFSVFFTPYLALLSRQVRRIEGYWGVMSLTQVMMSVTFPFGFILCSIFGMAAAYRPERNPDVTQALSDVFWFIFVGVVGPLIFQVVILAVAVFMDKRERPSFPRWFGYFNIWYAILGVPGCAIYLFKSGPLAWNGMFAFWIPLTVFSIWWIVTTFMLVKAVDVEAAEREASAAQRVWEPAA